VTVITSEGTMIMDGLWYDRITYNEWIGRTCLNQEQNGGAGVMWENMSQPGLEQRIRSTYKELCGRTYLNQEWKGEAEVYMWRGAAVGCYAFGPKSIV
jgi:hypothetical protein